MHRSTRRSFLHAAFLFGACLAALALAAQFAHGQGFGTSHLVELAPGDRPLATFAAYVNGDEHLDIVCAFVDSGSIAWYRNSGQRDPQFTRFTIEAGLTQVVDVTATDIDGDGDTDIVAVGLGGTLRWYENDGGYTPAFTALTIATGLNGPTSLVAVDLDNDGNVDIATSLANTNQVRWFESDGTSPPTFTARTITTNSVFDLLSRVVSGDMDGDGDVDFVVKSDSDNLGLVLRNNGQTPPGFTFTPDGIPLPDACASIFVADIDADGDQDIAAISATDGEVLWFENDPQWPGGFRPRTVASVGGAGRSVFAADLDGDGDVDIAGGWADIRQGIWFENNGQTPPQFTRRDIAVLDPLAEIEELFVADVDGDGDPDILTVGTNEVRWRESGLFGAIALPEEAIRNATADVVYPAPHMLPQAIGEAIGGDVLLVRGDIFPFPTNGDINLVENSSLALIALGNLSQAPTVGYYLSNDSLEAVAADIVGSPRFVQIGSASVPVGREILGREPGRISLQSFLSLQQRSLLQAATTIDMISEASLVVEAGSNSRIIAPGGTRILGGFGLPTGAFLDVTGPFMLGSTPSFDPRTVSATVNFATSAAAADVNGDGHTDVLSTSQADNTVYWHEHDGEDPPAFTAHVVSSGAGGARSVIPADLDGDSDIDVVAVAEYDDAIRWYRNLGGSPPAFEARTVFAAVGSGPQHAVAMDFDADGDVDVLSACSLDGTIRWHQNDGANPPSFTARIVFSGAPGASSVFAADMDGDGDLDVLSASDFDNSVRLYRRGAGSPPTFTALVLSSTAMGARSVHAADLDGDGRMDAIAASTLDNSIRWFRNNGGNPPTFTETVLPAPALGPLWVLGADMEGDGDADVLYASAADGAIRWLQNDGHTPPTFSPRDIYALAPAATCVSLADVDGDGLRDVLSSSLLDNTVRWHKTIPDQSSILAPGALLSGSADVRLARPVALSNGVIVARGDLTIAGPLTGSGTFAADTTNDSHINLVSSLEVIGDYTNNGATIIQRGTLSVLGTLTNNGIIIGDLGRSVVGGLFAQRGYTAGAGSTLVFPLGGTVSCGGAFDAAVNSNERFHLAAATLKLNGLPGDGPQSLEVMSVDIGPDPAGLDRAIPGHYPLGTLRIGPTATTVDLVDAHDNARDGQASCEAIYASELIVEAGARLNTASCRVYYQTLTLNGTVDFPANLIEITPPCRADFDGNGAVAVPDIFAFLSAWFAHDARADFDGVGGVAVPDIFSFLSAWFAGCP